MNIFGYAGNILKVDLSTGEIATEPLDPAFIGLYVGGVAASARLAYDLIPPTLEPLSADNPIIIGTSLFTGTLVPGSSKVPMVTKFPATGIIEAGSVGSSLGPNLKWAGYDFLIVKGKSEQPVYLLIQNETVTLCDAKALWGEDIWYTTDFLWEKHGDECSVMAIGPAGENQVKISIALVDKGSTIGKGGLGALMGHKNLKAVVVRGTRGFKVKDAGGFQKTALDLIAQMKADPNHDVYVRLGRMSRFENWAEVLGWPHHNVRMKAPKEITDLFKPDRYVDEVLYRREACPSCVTACKDHVMVKRGAHKGVNPYVSSLYGRIMNWGSRCEVGGYENAMKCQDTCNRTGLCVHSFTSLMDWAVDLYENRVISKKDTDGLELKRGFEPTMQLMDLTTRRQGFGAVLAEGWKGAMKAIGRNCADYAIQIKGTEPLFDPRLHRLGTVEFYQLTNPRGGWGSRGRSAAYIQKDRPLHEFVSWCESTGVSKDAIERIFAEPGTFNVGRLTRYAEDWCYLADTIGAPCMEGRVRNFFNLDVYQKLYQTATGEPISFQDIKKIGERAFVLLRFLNARAGFGVKDDTPPARWFEPMYVDGKEQFVADYYGKPLTPQDFIRLLQDYYDERGFSTDTGTPRIEKLVELGIGDLRDPPAMGG